MIIGYVVLFSWPLFVLAFFLAMRPAVALIATILIGYLFLPTNLSLDMPMLPSFDKNSITSLSALLGCLFVLKSSSYHKPIRQNDAKKFISGWLPKGSFAIIFLSILLIGSFLTVLTNSDTLVYGSLIQPAMRIWDAISTVSAAFLAMIPLLLGRKLLAYPDQHNLLLKAFVISGLIYALPAIYEVRMSPQLNYFIYGYFQHSWLQHIRGDGFRPIVFLQHGLWVSIFFLYYFYCFSWSIS